MTGIKTCIVTGQYPPQVGGVGHSAQRVAQLLAQNGLRVHVVALQKHPVPLPFDESFTSTPEGEVLVHRVKVFHPNVNDGAASEAEILTRYNREMFEALGYFQRRFGYEVLHAFFLYPAGFIAGLVARQHGVKMIASIRGNDVGKYAFDPLRLPFIRSALENADYVTSVATSLTELADRAITPVAAKAKTILNSVAPAKRQPQAPPATIGYFAAADSPRDTAGGLSGNDGAVATIDDLKGLVLGSSGLFRYKKGLVYLFKALAGLKGRFDYTLLLAGDFFKEEDRAPHLRDLRAYGLAERTIITGKIAPERMADYLQLFDVLVFPSLFSEGCPLTMLEAMALGKAIIGSRAGAIPEVIHHRENGLLTEPGASEEIARAILELAENPALRARLAQNAAQTAGAMSPQREWQQWLEVYQSLK